ncbi:MAG: SpoIIE family protein phosphatase [Leptospiraceae bacterium]|nr:SpoIIE family protein phosphatase [Leptospiraceae bacterium]
MLFERSDEIIDLREINEGCEYYQNLNWKSDEKFCNNHFISEKGHKIVLGNEKFIEATSFHNWETLDPSIQGSIGTAVYRIDLILPKGEYGIFQENWVLSSSGRIWVLENQKKLKLLSSIGYPSNSKDTTRPMWKGVSSNFETQGGNVSLIVEVANFHHRSGYLGYAINLGPKSIIQKNTMIYHQEQMLLCGFISMVGLYSFILFFFRTKQKELLWFSLLCIAISFRVALVSRIYQLYFPNSESFEILLKLEYLSFTLTPILFLLFIRYLLNGHSNKSAFIFAIFYPIAISCFILLTESSIFSRYLLAAIFSIFLSIAYAIYEMILKWRNQDSELQTIIKTLAIVFFLFSSAVVNDVLISFGIYQWYELSGIGLVIFIFGQAVMIAKINSNTWNKTDKLNLDILQMNKDLDRMIADRTQILQKTIDARHNDLLLAKQIQTNLMPQLKSLNERIQFHTYYEPMDEVGGDLYDVNQIGVNTYRIFLADATGHGVQAGLITMLVKSEYENLKFYADPPNSILDELNKRYISKYKYLNRFFTCILLDIDLDNQNIKMASAGHPSQYFYDSNTIKELDYTGPLMGFNQNVNYKLREISFNKQSSLLLFTDGLFEQFNSNDEILGEHRIAEFFLNICLGKRSYEELPKYISDWIHPMKIKDDICFIGISFKD